MPRPRSAAKSAEILAKEWNKRAGRDDVAPATLQNLDRFTFVIRPTIAGKIRRPFLVHGVSVDDAWADVYDPEGVEVLEKTIDENIV